MDWFTAAVSKHFKIWHVSLERVHMFTYTEVLMADQAGGRENRSVDLMPGFLNPNLVASIEPQILWRIYINVDSTIQELIQCIYSWWNWEVNLELNVSQIQLG